jgi:hypothetical protein
MKMDPTTKPTQIRIRIENEDVDLLDELAGKVLSRTDVASVLLNAAVEAVRKNKGRIHYWPPKFTVEESNEPSRFELNERQTPKRK